MLEGSMATSCYRRLRRNWSWCLVQDKHLFEICGFMNWSTHSHRTAQKFHSLGCTHPISSTPELGCSHVSVIFLSETLNTSHINKYIDNLVYNSSCLTVGSTKPLTFSALSQYSTAQVLRSMKLSPHQYVVGDRKITTWSSLEVGGADYERKSWSYITLPVRSPVPRALGRLNTTEIPGTLLPPAPQLLKASFDCPEEAQQMVPVRLSSKLNYLMLYISLLSPVPGHLSDLCFRLNHWTRKFRVTMKHGE